MMRDEYRRVEIFIIYHSSFIIHHLSFIVHHLKKDGEVSEEEQFWEVEDQRARLKELTAREGDEKESPLRRDVRSLGRLLGAVLKEQAGDSLFDAVEELRHLTTARRESGDTQERERLAARAESVVGRISVEESHRLTKAFAIYFELTNLAETNHRKRRRRAPHGALQARTHHGRA
jgi:phosphoenolpyruvate carboxylase